MLSSRQGLLSCLGETEFSPLQLVLPNQSGAVGQEVGA